MNTQELIEAFCTNHQELVAYINSLPEGQFTASYNGKWTAGQQLSHVYLCLVPISQALASKDFIRQKFGTVDRQIWEYDSVITNYKKALEAGGKAPDRFVPEAFDTSRRIAASAELLELLQAIRNQLNGYTDDELDTLVLPHPLLGNLTIREMFYLMTYHATHHHKQTVQNLEGYKAGS